MIHCNNCGELNQRQAHFCRKCGQRLARANESADGCWILVFIFIGLPAALLGSCALLDSPRRIDIVTLSISLLCFFVFGGTAAILWLRLKRK